MHAQRTSSLAFVAALGLGACGSTEPVPPLEAEAARDDERRGEHERMVERQLVARGITDERVLAAMRRVQRHRFVPEDQRAHDYDDGPLPIGEGQTISQPYIVALMSEALGLAGEERVLEIGTGSGYQAAVLAELAREVHTIEIVPALAERARRTLREQGYAAVSVRAGDGWRGWPEAAPFDAILVTAAPEELPRALVEQLRTSGRLVIPIGPQQGRQELWLFEKQASGELLRRHLIGVRFVPMTGG